MLKKNPVVVKNITIGNGIPKICVSIIGGTEEEIYKQAVKLQEQKADIAEWRMDYFESFPFNGKLEKLTEIIKKLADILEDMPIIATFRTKKEGGEKDIPKEYYEALLAFLIKNTKIDFIDMELFTLESAKAEYFVKEAHANKKKVILSSHDFVKTPKKEEIITCLCHMQQLGADLPKIAVMPQSSKDVLTLLSATEEMNEIHKETPIITMAMGKIGMVSRLSGEIFGSSVTFGCLEQSSAPGQIKIGKLRSILEVLHI